MRNPQRIETILAFIGQVWHKQPDWRLTQLIINVLGHSGDLFYVEDNVLEQRLRQRLREWGVQIELPIEEREAAS